MLFLETRLSHRIEMMGIYYCRMSKNDTRRFAQLVRDAFYASLRQEQISSDYAPGNSYATQQLSETASNADSKQIKRLYKALTREGHRRQTTVEQNAYQLVADFWRTGLISSEVEKPMVSINAAMFVDQMIEKSKNAH